MPELWLTSINGESIIKKKNKIISCFILLNDARNSRPTVDPFHDRPQNGKCSGPRLPVQTRTQDATPPNFTLRIRRINLFLTSCNPTDDGYTDDDDDESDRWAGEWFLNLVIEIIM